MVSRLALRLLARADPAGRRDALIGDLLEEFSGGRSPWWLCQQLVGLYAWAFAAHARQHARLTPCVIAVMLAAVLIGGLSIASVSSVLQAWLGVYLVAGTVSLFAHMLGRARVARL